MLPLDTMDIDDNGKKELLGTLDNRIKLFYTPDKPKAKSKVFHQ